jgi:hypothetical protein
VKSSRKLKLILSTRATNEPAILPRLKPDLTTGTATSPSAPMRVHLAPPCKYPSSVRRDRLRLRESPRWPPAGSARCLWAIQQHQRREPLSRVRSRHPTLTLPTPQRNPAPHARSNGNGGSHTRRFATGLAIRSAQRLAQSEPRCQPGGRFDTEVRADARCSASIRFVTAEAPQDLQFRRFLRPSPSLVPRPKYLARAADPLRPESPQIFACTANSYLHCAANCRRVNRPFRSTRRKKRRN